jgi:hypothetical protein
MKNDFGEDLNPLKTSPEQPLRFVVFDFKRNFTCKLLFNQLYFY